MHTNRYEWLPVDQAKQAEEALKLGCVVGSSILIMEQRKDGMLPVSRPGVRLRGSGVNEGKIVRNKCCSVTTHSPISSFTNVALSAGVC